MKKILPLIFVVLLASILIFYKFPNLPKYLAFDEVEFSRLALSLKNKPYIPYSPLATGHSTLYFYIILFSFNIFGVTNFALRFPAAFFGILSVVMFYLVVCLSFRASARNLATEGSAINASLDFSVASLLRNDILFPFLLTLIFLSSHWFLNFARFSFEATFLLFLELTSIYFLVKAQMPVKVSNFYAILSGIFSGLAFLSYTPGRIFFILPLLFITLKTLRTLKLYELFYFLIPFIVITAPLNLYFLNNKDSRIDQQFFLRNSEMTVKEKVSGLWHNISSTALMFNIRGDVNGRHNYPLKPALNPILGILFIIGLIISIKDWKNPINFFAIFYFLFSIFPAFMTYPWENPNMLRTFTVIPSVVFFIGNAIYHLGAIDSRLLLNKKMFVSCFLFLAILFSSFYEIRTYFKYQPSVFDQAFEMKKPLPDVFSEPNPYEKSH